MILHALRVLTVLALVADPIIRNHVKVIESTTSLVSHTVLFGDELLLASCNACKSNTVLASYDYGIAQKMYIWVAYAMAVLIYVFASLSILPTFFCALWQMHGQYLVFTLNKDFFFSFKLNKSLWKNLFQKINCQIINLLANVVSLNAC